MTIGLIGVGEGLNDGPDLLNITDPMQCKPLKTTVFSGISLCWRIGSAGVQCTSNIFLLTERV